MPGSTVLIVGATGDLGNRITLERGTTFAASEDRFASDHFRTAGA